MVTAGKYIIKQIFNNNVILAIEAETEKELIFIGKGIGFSRRKNDQFLKSEINFEKEFAPIEGAKRKIILSF